MTFRALSWGTAFADLDNDGDLDIVVANGHIYPQVDRHPEMVGTYAQANLLAENRGPGAAPTFRDATAEAGPGFAERWSSRGLAVGDYDNDGKLDLLITHLDAPPSLLHNTGADRRVAHGSDRRQQGRAESDWHAHHHQGWRAGRSSGTLPPATRSSARTIPARTSGWAPPRRSTRSMCAGRMAPTPPARAVKARQMVTIRKSQCRGGSRIRRPRAAGYPVSADQLRAPSTCRVADPVYTCRGRAIFCSGSRSISSHCASQPTVRGIAKSTGNISIGNFIAW